MATSEQQNKSLHHCLSLFKLFFYDMSPVHDHFIYTNYKIKITSKTMSIFVSAISFYSFNLIK